MEMATFLAKFLQMAMLRRTRHLARSRLSAPQQIDLFAAELQNAMGDMPAWSRLPTKIQAALISLITRLIREHADRSRLAQGRKPVMISDKIRPHHPERKALLYVRQSSICQVLHNRESRALQYAMRDRLMALGWSEIEAIDDDLGRLASARFRFPAGTTPESEFSGQSAAQVRGASARTIRWTTR